MILILIVYWRFLLYVKIVMVVIAEEAGGLVIIDIKKFTLTVYFFNWNH